MGALDRFAPSTNQNTLTSSQNNANAQLEVDRFGAFRNIVPSAPNPYCFSSLGARFTFRRIALAMLQPGCKHCGKSEEKVRAVGMRQTTSRMELSNSR